MSDSPACQVARRASKGTHEWLISKSFRSPPSPDCGAGAAFSDWVQVGSSSFYLSVVDALGSGQIIDPNAILTNSNPAAGRAVFSRDERIASLVGVRMRYDDQSQTNPVVKVFGRSRRPDGSTTPWAMLKSRLGDRSWEIATDPSDLYLEGTYYFTAADPEASYFDVQGCNEFVVGVEVAATRGEAALEVKFI